MWTAWSCDTVTGDRLGMIPVADASWSRAIGAEGVGSATVPLEDGRDGFSTLELRELLAHWKRTIVLDWDGDVKYAGLIRTRPYPGLGSRRITVGLVDLWGLWKRRLAIDHNHPYAAQWQITYSGTSLQTLAKRAVQRGTTGPAAPAITLPITLPADVAGSLTRTYFGYHYEYVADVLQDLMDEGLDIDFEPRWVSGKLNWLMRTGVPLVGAVRELHPTAPGGGVAAFGEQSDGARMTNNARYIGEGSEQDMLVRSNRNLASSLPLLDRVTDKKNVTSTSQLAALANRDLVAFEYQTTQYDFDVLLSGDGGTLRLADETRLFFSGDPWMSDGRHDRRVIGLSGTLDEVLNVSVQPTGGA